MKLYFNLLDACALRHIYAKLFDIPVSGDVFFKQYGYCCVKCKMNALPSCTFKTCEDVLKYEFNHDAEVWTCR